MAAWVVALQDAITGSEEDGSHELGMGAGRNHGVTLRRPERTAKSWKLLGARERLDVGRAPGLGPATGRAFRDDIYQGNAFDDVDGADNQALAIAAVSACALDALMMQDFGRLHRKSEPMAETASKGAGLIGT